MWLDVTLEGISFLLVSLLCLRIFWLYSTPAFRGQPGIAQVCAGALLVSLALLLDVSDDFTSLNFLVIVGDTPVEAFLEKVGYFAGYLMLAIGFAKWLPVLKTEQELRDQLRQSNSSLEQANHALKLQKDLYRAITTNLKTAILLLDRQGRARLWNPAASAILGYSDQELTGRDIRIICSQALEKVGEASPIQLFSEEQSRTWRNGEGLLSTQTGEPVPVEIAVQPAHLSDEYYWLCTIEDIRERQKQQQEREELLKQLRHVQKMEAIGLLAGGIAHDFNNILSAIIGYTEVALSQSTNEQLVKRSLTEVLKAGNRASDLVKRISTFGHKKELDMAPVNLNAVLDETLALLQETLPPNIRIERHQDEEQTIFGSATQLHQVLMNLCVNAYHAMPQGGVLGIRSQCETVPAEKLPPGRDLAAGDYIHLEISDTGCGIPEEVLERIFDPYFTTKPPGKGTGLGLSIVQGIIRDHRGWIHVDSHPGQGTCFHIFLPVCNAEKRTPSNGSISHALCKPPSKRTASTAQDKAIPRAADQMKQAVAFQRK